MVKLTFVSNMVQQPLWYLKEDTYAYTSSRNMEANYLWTLLLSTTSFWSKCESRSIPRVQEQNHRTDIIIYYENEQSHNWNLRHLFETAKSEGDVISVLKCTVKSKQVTFFGRLYKDRDIQPDPSKCQRLKKKTDLQRFFGMTVFLSSHIPKLSELT